MGKDASPLSPTSRYSERKYRPLAEWCLIRKKPRKQLSAGGIVIPDELQNAQRNEHTVGIVLAVGEGIPITKPNLGKRTPPDFKVGDEVIYNPYSAKVADRRLDLKTVLVPIREVIAVIEEGELHSL